MSLWDMNQTWRVCTLLHVSWSSTSLDLCFSSQLDANACSTLHSQGPGPRTIRARGRSDAFLQAAAGAHRGKNIESAVRRRLKHSSQSTLQSLATRCRMVYVRYVRTTALNQESKSTHGASEMPAPRATCSISAPSKVLPRPVHTFTKPLGQRDPPPRGASLSLA